MNETAGSGSEEAAAAGARLSLRERLASLATLVTSQPATGVAVLDRAGDFVDASDLCAATGIQLADCTMLRATALVEFFVPSDAVVINLVAAQAADRGISTTSASLRAGGTATVHLVDLNDAYGVRVAVIVTDSGEPISETPDITATASRTRVGVLNISAGGIVTGAEPSIVALLGRPADDLEGQPALALVHPDDHDASIANWVAAMDERGTTVRWRCRAKRADERYLWVDVAFTNLVDEAGDANVRAELFDVSAEVDAVEALRRSEARLDALLRRSRDVVAVLDPDGTLTYISPSAPQLFGYPYGSHLGTMVFDLVHPDDRDRATTALAARLRTTAPRDPLELRVAHADGTWHTLELVSSNLVDEPAVRGIVLNIRDITERKQAELLLRDSERRRDALLSNSSDVIFVTDATGVLRYISPAAKRVFGFDPDVWLTRNVLELVDPEDRARAIESLTDTAGTPGPNIALELRIANAAGETRHVEIVANNLLSDPIIAGIVFNARDVTERVEHSRDLRRAEHELTNAARRFETVLSNLSDLVSVIDADGNPMYVSPVAERMFGRRRQDYEGSGLFEFVHPDDLARTASAFRGTLAAPGLTPPFETRVLHEDGTYRVLEISANNRLTDPAIRGIIVNSRDVTERVEAARAQHDTDDRYRRIVEMANEGIWTIDVDKTTTFVNPRMAQMLGYTVDQMAGTPLFDFLDDEGRQITEEKLERRRSGISEHFDFKFIHADGTPVWAMLATTPLLDEHGEYAGSLALITDVTERRRVETALRDAEMQRQRQEAELERHRLEAEIERSRGVEAIGQLAAGIAHDFNNLLGVITNYATVAARHLPDGATRDDVARILDVAQEGSRLTQRLLLVGQRDHAPPEVVPLDETVARSLQLIEPVLGASVEVSTNLRAPDTNVAICAGGIEQILLNVLLNARDAMNGGGQIHVDTRVDADHVALAIRDTGSGMDPDTLERALQPFFSTKPTAQGTGLGLPTIKNIVERSGGTLHLASAPGSGTEVVVRLPRRTIQTPTETSPAH